MEENTMVIEEVNDNEENEYVEDTTEERSIVGTCVAMLIGSGLTLAAIAGGKKLKKLWKNRKSRKEDPETVDVDFVEINEDDEKEENSENESEK